MPIRIPSTTQQLTLSDPMKPTEKKSPKLGLQNMLTMNSLQTKEPWEGNTKVSSPNGRD